MTLKYFLQQDILFLLLSAHLTDHLIPAVWKAGLSSKYWVTEGDDVQERGPFRLLGLAWQIWEAATSVLCCVQTGFGPVITSSSYVISTNEFGFPYLFSFSSIFLCFLSWSSPRNRSLESKTASSSHSLELLRTDRISLHTWWIRRDIIYDI